MDRAWHQIALDVLKANEIRLIPYVPDNVLKPLIAAIHADPFFHAFTVAREEEAVGIVAGAWMAGTKGMVLMQTSGFATLANVLASLPCAFQIPVLLMISERGTLGEFNQGQAAVWRTMRPTLEAASAGLGFSVNAVPLSCRRALTGKAAGIEIWSNDRLPGKGGASCRCTG